MAEQVWYKEWFDSPYYHKLYFERDEKEAEAFIRKLVEHLKPAKGSRMLDIACGRGRHSRTLSSMGFDVTGIDLSPSSIEFAKKIETGKLEFFVHDMRLPFRANYYDYAFNFFTSFGYFRTRRELLRQNRDAQTAHVASRIGPVRKKFDVGCARDWTLRHENGEDAEERNDERQHRYRGQTTRRRKANTDVRRK